MMYTAWDEDALAPPPEVRSAAGLPENCFGQYIRVGLRGRGGMGHVWKAWDRELGRWVALKFAHFDTPEDLKQLKHEAQLAGRLAHPNVVPLHDFVHANNRHFIVMQYINGLSLDEYPRMDRRKLIQFARYATRGVANAHRHGILHRDLKPANILVDQEREQVFVTDFGISRPVDGRDSTAVIHGTVAYMSPEQVQGKRLDVRSDVYALGATLYCLLSDRPPFEDECIPRLMGAIMEEEPDPPIGVHPDLQRIVMRCLRKDPRNRYASILDLAADIDIWLRASPIRSAIY